MADAQSHFDGLSSLIAFAGFTIPARARFIARFVGSTLYSSITIGLVAGQAGALLPCGPLIPFMTGSWIGYTWACIGFWKQSKKKAISYARQYPKVMAHSLLTNLDIQIPADVEVNTREGKGRKEIASQRGRLFDEWILAGGIGRMSYAILAAQGCEEDIFEMQKNERQKMIDEYSEKD